MMREVRGRQFYLGIAAKCMVSQLSDFQLPPLYFNSLTSLSSILSQSFSLTSLVVFSRHLSNHTWHDQLKFSGSGPQSLLTSSSPFPYLFLKGTLLFFLRANLWYQVSKYSFSLTLLLLSIFFSRCGFYRPSCQDPYTWINTVVSWSFILRSSSSRIFLFSSPAQKLMFPKVMSHLHWTFESPLPSLGVSSSTLHNMLWAPWWPPIQDSLSFKADSNVISDHFKPCWVPVSLSSRAQFVH